MICGRGSQIRSDHDTRCGAASTHQGLYTTDGEYDMDTVRFGNIMRATAVEQAAISTLEEERDAAQEALVEAELELQAVRAQLAEMERLSALQQQELVATRTVAQHLLTRNQRLDASVRELLEHLQPTLHESDRRQRFLVANAYEAMGMEAQAAGVVGSTVRAVG